MRVPFLVDNRSRETDLSEVDMIRQIKRRHFLQTLGIVGVGLAFSPKQIFANPPNGILVDPVLGEQWRACVTSFVDIVCADLPDTARWINSQLQSARIGNAPRYDGLHYYYASPHIFVDTLIDPQVVICRNGFMVNQFPYYGVDCSCPSLNDLNAPEISRITNQTEMNFYGCVLAPNGARVQFEENDHADYNRTIRNYSHDPNQWRPAYKRILTKKNGQAYRAYGLAHKTETDANGKAKGDVIISSYNI